MRIVVRTGIDLLQISRFEAVYLRYGARLLKRIYTLREQGYCEMRMNAYATRWAAKEATAKMLGVGLRGLGSGAHAVAWTAIELVHDDLHKPCLVLHDAARERACRLGIDTFDVSVSHDAGLVVVSVVGVGLVSDTSEA